MAKKQPLGKRYEYPLPIHPVGNLPPLITHNPISWLHWVYCYYRSVNELKPKIAIELQGERYAHILIKNPDDMTYLWENGFFGTGQFSRSEPTWKLRTATRMGEYNGEVKYSKRNLALEDITEQRRLQRIDFKRRRQLFEKQLLELRKNGGTIEQENRLLIEERESLRSYKDEQLQTFNKSDKIELRTEDGELLNDEGKIIELETLELSFVEALFLSFALPVLNISPHDLIGNILGPVVHLTYDDIYPAIKLYVAYHYYRSRGWCVRSGIKFGCDYLLYKRGPPFQHAHFCVKVLDVDEKHDYTWYSCLARVVGGTKKTLLLCYVNNTSTQDRILKSLKQKKLVDVFSSYEVSELIYRRWVPGKNRD